MCRSCFCVCPNVPALRMPFERVWDDTCPLVYDQWEADGVSWVIQDLRPEDDIKAMELLLEIMSKDEILCVAVGLSDDAVSMQELADAWMVLLAKRMTLACYVVTDQGKELVALNCCVVNCRGEHQESKINGESFKHMKDARRYAFNMVDSFEYLGLDKLLYSHGFVVQRDYRGAKLGARILAARTKLALSQGIKGTSSVFSAPASQRSAELAGFIELASCSLAELAEHFPRYPKDETKTLKLMVKRFDS